MVRATPLDGLDNKAISAMTVGEVENARKADSGAMNEFGFALGLGGRLVETFLTPTCGVISFDGWIGTASRGQRPRRGPYEDLRPPYLSGQPVDDHLHGIAGVIDEQLVAADMGLKAKALARVDISEPRTKPGRQTLPSLMTFLNAQAPFFAMSPTSPVYLRLRKECGSAATRH
jgi:hypothetical protein